MKKSIVVINNKQCLKYKCPACGHTNLIPLKENKSFASFKCSCGYFDVVVVK